MQAKKHKIDYFSESLKKHREWKGKIEVKSKVPLRSKDDLSLAYTPGVAQACKEIARNPEDVYRYTSAGNMVAIVTDGSAVLGLGNLGARAALPVMEGKAVLFKEFGRVDAFPVVIDSQDTEVIIQTVKMIAPGFGGINLEDISAPRCFEIEKRLDEELDIPVFHDDQHGTAVVVLAALINAARIFRKDIRKLKVVIAGAGAAGTAITKLLIQYGVKDIVIHDHIGRLDRYRKDLKDNPAKMDLVRLTESSTGVPIAKDKTKKAKPADKGLAYNGVVSLADSIKGRDVFIGVSAPGIVTREMVKSMAKDPFIFALANPIPEIMPEEARAGGAAVIGTGRSDYPNQINNVLAFPQIFRGALDARAKRITQKMMLAAAKALADSVDPVPDKILPSPFEKGYRRKVAMAVRAAANYAASN